MKKSTRRWLEVGAAAAAVSAAAAASHKLTKYMMGVALDRNKPKSILDNSRSRQKLRGTPYQEMFLQDIEIAAEKLRNTETRRVEIQSNDGIPLVGHLRECAAPQRIVLAMHGWRSSWDQDFGMVADFWEESNCTVLYAEQRGQNNSGGDYMGFGMLERYDCLDWANWLNREFGSQIPIYLAGVSMGATTVLMASNLNLPKNVRGIAADCGFTSAEAIWEHITTDNLHLSYGIRRFDIEDLCRRKLQLGPMECSTTEALKNTKIPVLLVHGTDDTFVPVEMTYENYKACAGPKQLLIVPGADHGMSYYVEKDSYEKAAREFWKTCEADPLSNV